jgi:hypothetical protein
MATGLEQGVVALLGSKSSRSLLEIVGHEDLILICCALYTIATAVPRGVALVGRISSLMAQVFATIALNTTLAAVAVPEDPPLACVNLLGVFMFSTAFQQDGVGITAQYLLISNLSMALQGFGGDTLAVAWAVALIPPMLGVSKDLVSLAQLVTVETFTGYLRGLLPQGGLLPSTLLLLYLTAPFSDQFPLLTRLSRFAVFAVSNDPQIHAIPLWIVGSALWALWLADPDRIGRAFAATAGANVAVLVLLDSTQFAMDNDPAPVLIGLLVTIRILESQSSP